MGDSIEGRVYHEVTDTSGGNFTYAYKLESEDVADFIEQYLRSNQGKVIRITVEELGEKMCEDCGENEAEMYLSVCKTCFDKMHEELHEEDES